MTNNIFNESDKMDYVTNQGKEGNSPYLSMSDESFEKQISGNDLKDIYAKIIDELEVCSFGYKIIDYYNKFKQTEKEDFSNYCESITKLALLFKVNNEYVEKGYLALAKMMNFRMESGKMKQKAYSESAYELLMRIAQIAALADNTSATYAAFSASTACKGAELIFTSKENAVVDIELSIKDLKQVMLSVLKENNITDRKLYEDIRNISCENNVKELVAKLNSYRSSENDNAEKIEYADDDSRQIYNWQENLEKTLIKKTDATDEKVEEVKTTSQSAENDNNLLLDYAYDMEDYTKKIMLKNVSESVLVQANMAPGYVYHLVKG